MSWLKDTEILIDDIPEEGLSITVDKKAKWFSEVIAEVFGSAFLKDDEASFSAEVLRVSRNVMLDGRLSVTYHPDCDRCLVQFKEELSLPFHTILAPLYESKRQKEAEEAEEIELVKEDLEFGYYEGDRFDLSEIVREQALLAKPMKNLCGDGCKGLCQMCGKNLNEGPCSCSKDTSDPRFAVLKGIKLP